MKIIDDILIYLNNPIPIWNIELTKDLVKRKWLDLQKFEINKENYNTTVYSLDHFDPTLKKLLVLGRNGNMFFLEPKNSIINSIYVENIFDVYDNDDLFYNTELIPRLQEIFEIIYMVDSATETMNLLVKSFQIIIQKDPDYDISYSHPLIPFSIFFSLCKERSIITGIRAAESILHEIMHLKLTLIEEIVPLVNYDYKSLFFSPWKNEFREVRGLIHGLYVFRSIFEFYSSLESKFNCGSPAFEYIQNRKNEIREEILSLNGFSKIPDLNSIGYLFVSKLNL